MNTTNKTIVKNSIEYVSKRGTLYEIRNINGKLVCFNGGKRCEVTKEIMDRFIPYAIGGSFAIYAGTGNTDLPGGVGGYGIVIVNISNSVETELYGGYKATTSNRMQIRAAIEGLNACPEGASVELITQSEYIVNTIGGTYRRMKNLDLWREFDDVCRGRHIKASLPFSPSDKEYCKRCCRIATAAMYSKSLLDDSGYQRKSYTSFKGQRSGVRLDVSDRRPFDKSSHEKVDDPAQYANEHKVNIRCAYSLKSFWESDDRSDAAYRALRTGGIDAYSNAPPEYLRKCVGDAAYDEMAFHLSGRELYAAMRWFCRGLSSNDSIKKVIVDRELNNDS